MVGIVERVVVHACGGIAVHGSQIHDGLRGNKSAHALAAPTAETGGRRWVVGGGWQAVVGTCEGVIRVKGTESVAAACSRPAAVPEALVAVA